MFTFNGYKHQGHSICSRNPPSMFVIGAFFRLRFGRIPVLCKICRFRSIFFLFISIIMKTVGKCSLLTVISIKDIRFAVENHPPNFFVYLNYYENCWEMFFFNGYTHQGHSICSRKPPSKFVIGVFFRLVMLYKKTKKKFQKSINNSKNTYLFENSTIHRFAVFGPFFFVYLNYYENCWEMFTFKGYKHQGHSVCSRKPPSKFVIGAFFRLVMLYKETKKKFQKSINNSKNTYYFEKSYLNIDLVEFRFYFTFNGYKHQGHSICSRKPPPKFVIGVFFRLVMLYKETKKKFRNL
ncbi:hypothetical protein AGLY_017848 [Aphis glycines]|uniref:Uncharacterized protein n=1 Tax=Aphis glycines TaxID=307491 RepID=A0A6G0SUW3_APHGL|nr:hypothetical protein AGLY_017848 [Aphis glycines]